MHSEKSRRVNHGHSINHCSVYMYQLRSEAPEDMRKPLDSSKEKGSYLWLSALPLRDLGYSLNKVEFHDALAVRYNR